MRSEDSAPAGPQAREAAPQGAVSGFPTSGQPAMSLVIPCYDEAHTLPRLVQRIEESFDKDTEVVLVDNGSTDETPAIMASLAGHPIIRSVRVEVNQGYGYGILAGLRAARGRFLGWTHGDLQADPADAMKALELIRARRDQLLYVKGRRYGRPFQDVVFTVGMSVFETLLLRMPLWDINAQPNVFSRQFYEAVASDAPHDFSLDLYFYHAARRRRLPILRFPVRFGQRLHGVSHWNVDWAAKKRFIMRTIEFSLQLRKRVSGGARPQ
ncbi:MAG TPA: glycosyltransferase family 2 protein [Methylomirabilota bacterium]|nr:glycosyltransferase family 2 protein [Methylomirabilota bacterium]